MPDDPDNQPSMKIHRRREVKIEPHEIEAMRQLVINVRAIATTLITGDHSQRLLNWTQMVEDVVERIDKGVGK
jgi:hypothetical protein